MTAAPGDRVVVPGRRPGTIAHVAEVIEVLGPAGRPPYRVRWRETGLEGVCFPGPDAFVEHRTGGADTGAVEPRGRRYELWQILRPRMGKRLLRFLRAVDTAAEANLLADSIARDGRVPRTRLVVQDTERRRFLRRSRRQQQ